MVLPSAHQWARQLVLMLVMLWVLASARSLDMLSPRIDDAAAAPKHGRFCREQGGRVLESSLPSSKTRICLVQADIDREAEARAILATVGTPGVPIAATTPCEKKLGMPQPDAKKDRTCFFTKKGWMECR